VPYRVNLFEKVIICWLWSGLSICSKGEGRILFRDRRGHIAGQIIQIGYEHIQRGIAVRYGLISVRQGILTTIMDEGVSFLLWDCRAPCPCVVLPLYGQSQAHMGYLATVVGPYPADGRYLKNPGHDRAQPGCRLFGKGIEARQADRQAGWPARGLIPGDGVPSQGLNCCCSFWERGGGWSVSLIFFGRAEAVCGVFFAAGVFFRAGWTVRRAWGVCFYILLGLSLFLFAFLQHAG